MQLTATINNGRTTTTGALRLELWAFERPFDLTPPAQAGYRLATLNVAALAAGAAVNLTNQLAAFSPPASGTWNATFLVTEETAGTFVVRASFNFAAPLAVAGIMASYAPVPAPIGAANIPASLDNLLVDGTAVYWRAADSGSIGTVGLTPGSAPRVLTNFGGGLLNPFTIVQDNLYLYVMHGVINGTVIRVSKTTGAQAVLASPGPPGATPRAMAIGIQRTGGKLYFAAWSDLEPGGGFIPLLMSSLSTQGGAITNYGAVGTPLNRTAPANNTSPVSFTADLTHVYWIDAWDRSVRHMPLAGGPSAPDFPVTADAGFLTTFTTGPAGSALFWLEGPPNARVLKRRLAGSVIVVANNVQSANYAVDGERVYFVSGATQQLSAVSINGGPVTALLSALDTGIVGEIATDGNSIYWVSMGLNLNTNIKRLVLGVRDVPLVVQPPINQNVAPGAANLEFTALAASGGLSYVWKRNGVALIPATTNRAGLESGAGDPPRAASAVSSTANSATLTLSNITAADAGFYSCVITNRAGSVETDAAILTVDTGGPSRIINVSTRGLVQAGAALTPGFVMRGSGSKQLLIRAIGPTLSAFGLDALSDTTMEVLNQQTGASVVTNDDWGGSTTVANSFAAVGAFPLGVASRDAAVVSNVAVNANGYSVRIMAAGAADSGLALAEVYDADALTSPAKLINVSTLGFAGTGANALTPGFVIGGSAAKQVLIRAIGPGLAAFNIGGALADPQLSVIPLGMNIVVARNDDWAGTAELKAAFGTAGAFQISDTGKDAALVVRLPPGGYSVVVTGAGGTTGPVLVEVYDLDP